MAKDKKDPVEVASFKKPNLYLLGPKFVKSKAMYFFIIIMIMPQKKVPLEKIELIKELRRKVAGEEGVPILEDHI
jgi:hypothetical protein